MPQFPHLQIKAIEIAGFQELAGIHRSDLCLAVPESPYLGAAMPLLFLLTVGAQREAQVQEQEEAGWRFEPRAETLN